MDQIVDGVIFKKWCIITQYMARRINGDKRFSSDTWWWQMTQKLYKINMVVENNGGGVIEGDFEQNMGGKLKTIFPMENNENMNLS